MMHKLRKTVKALLLALIMTTAILPSVALVFAPAPVHAADSVTVTQDTKVKGEDTQLNIIGNAVVTAVKYVVELIVGMLGKLTVQLIHILIMVAGYNSFMDSKAIGIGWTIVRDVANLFFVAIIIVISIGSIVSPERFGGAKKILKVLLYAIFVNFSRTIAAFFIDISQLIMLTFVNGFAAAAGGNFVEALGITKLVTVQTGTAPLTLSSILGGLFLALIMMVIITVIIAVMVIVLVTRMVMLWMLVVLSPIAFAMAPYERTHEYYAKWWKDLEKQLTVGPIVAFFLWLSLASFQGSSGSDISGTRLEEKKNAASSDEQSTIRCGDTEACSEENMIRYVIATVMLLAGLSFAQEYGGMGGALAGQVKGAGQRLASGAVRRVGSASWAGAKAVGKGAYGMTPIPLAANKLGDRWTRTKQRAATALGNSGFARMPIVGRIARGAAGGVLASSAKRDEAQLTEARGRMKNYTPEMLAAVLNNRTTTTDAERRAAAMTIVGNRQYKNANANAVAELPPGATPQQIDDANASQQRAPVYNDALAQLQEIPVGRYTDVDDAVNTARDTRPDRRGGGFNPAEYGAGLTRDEALKINWGAIPQDMRNQVFQGMAPPVFDATRLKASGNLLRYMDAYRMGNAPATRAAMDAAVTGGMNVATAPLERFVPPAPVPPGAPAPPPPPPGTPRPTEVDINLPLSVLQTGNRQQVRDLLNRGDVNRMREAINTRVNQAVNFTNDEGMDAGNTRISDDNLRMVETAAVLGQDINPLYRIRDNGDFSDVRGENSFNESMQNSPMRLQLLLRMQAGQLQGRAGEIVHENTDIESLDAAAALAQTPQEWASLRRTVNYIQERANYYATNVDLAAADRHGLSSDAFMTRQAELRDYISAHPELGRLV
jgi:hypothetical protein